MTLALTHPMHWNTELSRLFDAPNSETACEIVDTPEAYKIYLDVPGVRKEDLEIEVKDRKLHVLGERRPGDRPEHHKVLHQERQFGKFRRTFSLPEGIAEDEARASFTDGVLEIVLPKAPVKSNRILIN